MKRRSVLMSLGATAVAGLTGNWEPRTTAASQPSLPPDHAIRLVRVLASLQMSYRGRHGRLGTLKQLIDMEAASGWLQAPMYRELSSGRDGSTLGVRVGLSLDGNPTHYHLTVDDTRTGDVFYINEKNVIHTGRFRTTSADGSKQFLGRPIMFSDLRPTSWTSPFHTIIEFIAPTIYAGMANYNCCCCASSDCCHTETCNHQCPGVDPGCTVCGEGDPGCIVGQNGQPYCCVQGYQKCPACCADDQNRCPCVWNNSNCGSCNMPE